MSLQEETPRRRGRPPRSEHDSELRDRAIEVARTLLVSGGGALSMEGLARVLGVRAPSLYHHFPGGRTEMVLAIAGHYSALHGEALGRIAASSADPVQRLREVSRYFAGPAALHPYHILTEERRNLPEEAQAQLRVLFTTSVEAPLLKLMRDGQEQGKFRRIDPELAIRVLLTVLLRLGQINANHKQREILPDFVSDLFVDGIGST